MLRLHRLEILLKLQPWVLATERWAKDYLVTGSEVNVERISPYLELCVNDRQHALWRYFRLWSSIPYNRGCGRLLRYLIRDGGQPSNPVMGVAALSSPVLICPQRDKWIGWQYPRDQELKRQRLLTCMDLSVCMAVPPYNRLVAGKMVAMAMLSDQVAQDYRNKFEGKRTPGGLEEGRLALVTTTSLYGSSVQYNRLRIDGRLAFIPLGYTQGYGNAHLTESDFAAMESYLRQRGKGIPKGWGTGRSYRLRVYTAYYRLRFQLPQAPNHRTPRSVYVAPLGQLTREFLLGHTEDFRPWHYDLEELTIGWKERWLARRLLNESVMKDFRSWTPAENLLSREIVTAIEAAGMGPPPYQLSTAPHRPPESCP